MKHARTDYERLEQSSPENRRLLRQEELILEVTEAMTAALKDTKRSDLAKRLGRTKGFVSQVLAGGRNLTLRTIADIADALGYRVRVIFERVAMQQALRPEPVEFISIPAGNLMPASLPAARPRCHVISGPGSTTRIRGMEYGAAA